MIITSTDLDNEREAARRRAHDLERWQRQAELQAAGFSVQRALAAMEAADDLGLRA